VCSFPGEKEENGQLPQLAGTQARRGMHLLAFHGVWRQDALTSCYAGVEVEKKIQ
jgi:hypothetical protein